VGIPSAITLARRTLGALWLFSLAVIVLLALATNLGPKVGFEVFAIRGGSMAPAIPLGGAVVAVRTEPDAIQVGDTVTVRADNGVIYTHRVVDIQERPANRWLRTKGDANATADAAPVPATSVVGVVRWTVPLVGYLMAMLTTPAGLLSVVAYAVALLAAVWELEEVEASVQWERQLRRTPDVARA
jgi:signal peptidase I